MKNYFTLLIAFLIAASLISSCKKDNKNAPNNLPSVINNIVSTAILDTLKKDGTIINGGTTPPIISGYFLLHPDSCTFDNSHFHNAGLIFDDYLYNFYGQDNAKHTIALLYRDVKGGDVGSDTTATFISGSGSMFSVFIQAKGVEDSISYTRLQVISGELTTSGIKNFQLTLYFQQKGPDPHGYLTEVGSTRIFVDEDGITPIQLVSTKYVNPLKTFGITNNTVTRILSMGRKGSR